MMISLPDFPDSISLAATPTPLRRLRSFDRRPGYPEIWLKHDDMTGSVLSGNKVRKLEFLLADALYHGADTIITCGGLQSNHCRATALACARLGLNCVLLLRDGDLARDGGLERSRHEGNLFLDGLAGAEIHVIDRESYRGIHGIFAETERELAGRGAVPYSIPTGGSNGVGVWGYLRAGLELWHDCEQAKLQPDAVVCATGSGGTQAGLTLARLFCPLDEAPAVYGIAVCDSADYFKRKVRKDLTDWTAVAGLAPALASEILAQLAIQVLDDYIGPGYAQAYPEELTLIRQLAREEGVVLDPVYTGKAFYGMLKEIENGCLRDAKQVVFVHTGGVFGLFPYAERFSLQ